MTVNIVPILGLLVALLGVGAFAGVRTWTHIVAVSVDLATFSIVKGVYDVTISSWCGLEIRKGKDGNKFGRFLGWILNHIQKNHCELAIAGDQERAASALEYLTTGGPYKPPG